MEHQTIGQRLRAVRKANGLTQTAFAKELMLSKNAISLMENGARNLSKRTIASVCERFSVSEDWLISGEGAMLLGERERALRQLDEVCARYKITGKRRDFLEKYISLPPNAQEAILAFAKVLQSVTNSAEESESEDSSSASQ